jgi:ABC-type lipoprotein export system ATPase subunit
MTTSVATMLPPAGQPAVSPCERPPVLSVRGAGKVFHARRQADPVTAVDAVHLDVDAGDFVVITGRSGSGKTTLLNLAAGLARPTSGTVLLDGADLWSLPDAARARLRNERVGFIFQFPSLIPNLSVLENVLLPTMLAGPDPHRDSAAACARELLETVGVADRAGSWPRQLSAGQQQRVVIARALILRPSILFADEPTSSLDEETEIEVMTLFHRLNAADAVTILMVTHGSDLVRYASRHVRMSGGTIAEEPPLARRLGRAGT